MRVFTKDQAFASGVDAREARGEFAAGKTRATSIDDLMHEIES